MIVVIDVSQKQKESVYLLGGEKKEAENAGSLLLLLDELLVRHKTLPEELEGVLVVVGEGRFTSTRSAVIIANTFAYIHSVPIATCTSEEIASPQEVIKKLARADAKYISAHYFAPPNITIKK